MFWRDVFLFFACCLVEQAVVVVWNPITATNLVCWSSFMFSVRAQKRHLTFKKKDTNPQINTPGGWIILIYVHRSIFGLNLTGFQCWGQDGVQIHWTRPGGVERQVRPGGQVTWGSFIIYLSGRSPGGHLSYLFQPNKICFTSDQGGRLWNIYKTILIHCNPLESVSGE